MKWLFSLLLSCCGCLSLSAQSVELMPGHKFLFTDVQFLKNFDPAYRFTLFSRTRARIVYDNDQVDFFSGAYLNYTSPSGFGGSVVGRITQAGSDVDLGAHFFKQSSTLSFFGLASASITNVGVYSWFSILRYRPALSEQWKLYISLELFSALNKGTHLASTQRIRLGLEIKSYQFGLATNLTQIGDEFSGINENIGLFLRKEF